MEIARADLLYPTIALQYLPTGVGLVFIIGLVAAAYSSADSALTALTTSFCIDFLGFQTKDDATGEAAPIRTRYLVHLGFSLILLGVIVLFWWINDQSVISGLFRVAGYTYGPLLGLYAFGLLTPWRVRDVGVPIVCVLAPVLTFLINENSVALLWGYKFGFELLLVNGLLTFLGLLTLRQGKPFLNEPTTLLDERNTF